MTRQGGSDDTEKSDATWVEHNGSVTGSGASQVPTKPHDSGSQANETVDGLDAQTEALRHAAEDTPSAAAPDDEEKVPVFDRAGAAPKI
ncbi:hypothetical protein AB4Z51_21030 [Bradyrhizobium sp. 2TAF36]